MFDVDFADAEAALRDQPWQMPVRASGQREAGHGLVPSGPEQTIGVAHRLSMQQTPRKLSEPAPRAARRREAPAAEDGVGSRQTPDELVDLGGGKLTAGFEGNRDLAADGGDSLAERRAETARSIEEQQAQAGMVVEQRFETLAILRRRAVVDAKNFKRLAQCSQYAAQFAEPPFDFRRGVTLGHDDGVVNHLQK
jgi:hypothetical protein